MACPHCNASWNDIRHVKCKKCGVVLQTYCISCGKIIDNVREHVCVVGK